MRISSKVEYGIMALVDLALHGREEPTKIREIARRQKIPKKYLEQVLLDLKRAGIVGSSRGKHGGYFLKREPDEITVLDVLDQLEEGVDLVNPDRDRSGYMQSFWDQQRESIREQLAVPIQHLLDLREENEKRPMYHI